MICPQSPGNFLGRFDLVVPDPGALVPDIATLACVVAVVVGCLGLVLTLSPRKLAVAPGSAVQLASPFLFPVALPDVVGAASGAPDLFSSVVGATSGALVIAVGCGLLWLASRVGRRG